MSDAHHFLLALATVLGVAALTTVLFQKLRQPVVLGYLVAGMIVGPHVPLPLVADPEIVQTLSELGVILLMFALGLEFSLRKLLQVGAPAGVTAIIQCSLMIWLGFIAGRALGWTSREALFTGALIAISSTTIIAKAFAEQGIGGRLRALVVGILIVEDLIAVLLMAVLTAVSTGAGLSASALAVTIAKLGGFLLAFIGVGLWVVPRTVRAIVRLDRTETTVIATIAICFAGALLAQRFGYSVALGAFLSGSLVSESGEGKRLEHLIEPVRDIFAAIFFVSVGMMIDPRLVGEHWPAIAVLTVVVVVGKFVGVALGTFLTGSGVRLAVQAGLSLAQIGEFSFIIAGLGTSLGATREFLYPVAVAVSALTTLTTPWLIRGAGPVANLVDRRLPHSVQTFASLYGSWIDRLKREPSAPSVGRQVRRRVVLLLIDAAVVTGLIIGTGRSFRPGAAWMADRWNLAPVVGQGLLLALGLAAVTPFAIGLARTVLRLGVQLSELALPRRQGRGVDLAEAPRRAMRVALQLAIFLATLLPMLALMQPFVPRALTGSGAVLLIGVGALALARSTRNLAGHLRAGSEMLVELLARQTADPHAQAHPHPEPSIEAVLPGIGAVRSVRIPPRSSAAGRTLGALNLRGITGATVLAVHRASGAVPAPGPREQLAEDDVLAVTGTDEAIAAAEALLTRIGSGPNPPA